MSGANSWLRGQRKSDLVELADRVGFKEYDGLKKSDLEVSLDEYLAEHSTKFSSDTKLAPYYTSRAKAIGSPVKKEAPELKVAKKRQTKASQDEIVAASDEESSRTSVIARTPGRALSLASRIPLPATPADVAHAVDRSTTAVRQRVASIYADSGITEGTQAARESLSTVNSVLFVVAAFELFYLRPEVLADRYAFTVPAVAFLGTPDYPVHIPDMFLLLTASFWSPALTWLFTSAVAPAFLGYFFNLSAAHQTSARGRRAAAAGHGEFVVDPLTFSVVKALLTYVVYAQGVTFGGWIDDLSVARINSALYGGYKGVLAGTLITGLMSVYDAVLRK